jgi:hypothetical protein
MSSIRTVHIPAEYSPQDITLLKLQSLKFANEAIEGVYPIAMLFVIILSSLGIGVVMRAAVPIGDSSDILRSKRYGCSIFTTNSTCSIVKFCDILIVKEF